MRRDDQQILRIVCVGVMAAMIFAVTSLVRLPIPTPVGETQIKLANALCLLSGMLFGGVWGGLASGIGSALFDLTNPAYTAYAPFTLAFFFVMSYLCGTIANARGARAQKPLLNLLAATTGAVSYWVLNISRNVLELTLGEKGMSLPAALAAVSPQMITSAINVLIAIIGATLLIAPLQKALHSAGLLDRLKD